jgi:hypothetical protein
MRYVLEGLPITAPRILGVQGFPVLADWEKNVPIIRQISINEEIKVDCTALQVVAVHGLGPSGLHVNLLLFGSPIQFPTGHHEARLRSELDKPGHIQQERRLFFP